MSVSLSSLSFQESQPPIISTDEAMPARYRLRAKFILTDGTPFQSINAFENNGFRLEQLPPPGTYAVALYWIKYDDTTGTDTVGPQSNATVTVIADAAPCPCAAPGPVPCATGPSTLCVCGDQTQTPDNPDQGACAPYRTKVTCEAPKVPQPECGELNFVVEYNPDKTPRFDIVSVLFDDSCDAILDQGGNEILTIVV